MPSLPRILYYLAGAMQRLKWDSKKLRNYQEKRLRHVVRFAYNNISFYHDKFKGAGIKPNDIRGVDDLNKVPITEKDELRWQPTEKITSPEFPRGNLTAKTTSGSTGRPLKLYLTAKEDDWRRAIYMRANISCGQRPRDKWVVIADPRHFGATTRIQRILGIYAQTCISIFDDIGVQVSKIAESKPNVLDGYSSCILLLAKIHESGRMNIQPRIVFGNAEVIDERSKRYIEETFDAPYYDQYGCVEFNRTAWQCPERRGYHLDVDSVITQFVDKEGDEVSAGERGEIVQTSLFNYAMPFLRYEVGDVGVPSDDECSCGRKLPLMKTVEGRTDSLIILPDGRMLSPRMLTVALSMFDQYESIEQFRIVQKEVNLMEILIKTRDSAIDKHAMETNLVAHFNRMFHFDEDEMVLRVKFVDDIALGKSGKLNAVTSYLNKEVFRSSAGLVDSE